MKHDSPSGSYAAALVLAEMLVQESSAMASSCGFPPQVLAKSLAFSAVKVALLTSERKNVDPTTELLKELTTAMEEAYCMYSTSSESGENFH
jgi:hypothetical protein